MKPFFLKVDALDFALNVGLSQYGSGEQLHLVGFHSKEFLLVEINYEIHWQNTFGYYQCIQGMVTFTWRSSKHVHNLH